MKSSLYAHIEELIRDGRKVDNSFKRVDAEHPLDIFLGIDENGCESMVIAVDAREPIDAISTKYISVQLCKYRQSGQALRFSLQNEDMHDLFCKLCEDMISSTRDNDRCDIDFILNRWNSWVRLFTKERLALTEEEIMGLIGELLVLDDLISAIGVKDALKAYVGAEMAHKDFVLKNSWLEVKAIHCGKDSVTINSVEQLDSEKEGRLVIVSLDENIGSADDYITLNELVTRIMDKLSESEKRLFMEKLNMRNYSFDSQYDVFRYLVISRTYYRVGDEFPRIMRADLPTGISKIKYDISLASINDYRVENE